MSRTFALIPAAGKSRRMGRPKLGLPLGVKTVLEAVVSAVTHGGVDVTLVVLGPTERELGSMAERAGASVLQLSEDTAEMRDTVQRGLDWLEKNLHPSPDDGWLLLPADHPCVDRAVVQQLLAAVADLSEAGGKKSIVIPMFEGQRGHPVWISWAHVNGIRAMPSGVGLNMYLRERSAETLELRVQSESVLWDLDTPEDYEQMKRRIGS